MSFLEKHLIIKPSTIPNAGLGLFTTIAIAKGESIVRYKGSKTTWKDISGRGDDNLYIMYVTADNVIDASKHKKSFARYANDATGLTKIKGLKNNGAYVHDEKGRVYIEAKRNIAAGEEILVGYGKDYWDTIRHNMKVEADQQKEAAKKN